MRSSKLMRQLGPALLCTGLVFGLLVTGPELAAQRTITVCSSGCDYATIQQAIDAASAGDTIEVRAGTYLENLTISDKQDLILQGAGRDQVTLDGSLRAAEQDIIPGILILNSRNITIRGFKIINSRRGLEAINSTLLLLEANAFENNLRQGIAIADDSEAQLVGNIVKGTQPDRDGAHGQGIDIFGSQAVLQDNTIIDSADCGLRVTHSGERPGQASGSNNTIQNNKGGDLCGNAPLTLLAQPPPEGTLEQVAVPTDVSTIQEAVNKVKVGGTITVAAGTYQEQVQIYKSVKIIGAGPDQTVLQAPGPEWTALNIATDQLDVMIEGLKVTGGRRGVQIDTGPAGSVNLRNVKVESNGSGGVSEGGIMIFGQGVTTLDQAGVSGNRGEGGLWAFGQPKITIQNSTISQNNWDGLVADGQSTITIENSKVMQNARGIAAFDQTVLTIRTSTISENLNPPGERNTGWGIVLWDSVRATIVGSTIARNEGVAVKMAVAVQATLQDNTVIGNMLNGILVGDTSVANETIQAELSRNQIQNNANCGVWTDRDPRITITGQGNMISGNAVANLCGDLSKFPPGFGGGK
jgi:hypothetical protein